MKLYKILVNGKSCYGGDFKWSLPKGNRKGKWHKYEGEVKICNTGFHLTNKPYNWYKWGCTAYEAEAKDVVAWEGDKCVAREVRLLKEVPHPKWWTDTISWVDTLKDIAWLKPDGNPNPEWKLFDTRAAALNAARVAAWDAARAAAGDAALDAALNAARVAALDAAGDAAWDAARVAAWDAARVAARDAAWDAAWDAALEARMILTQDLNVERKHRVHAKARMEVWQKGYGLACDVNGVLYVYKKL